MFCTVFVFERERERIKMDEKAFDNGNKRKYVRETGRLEVWVKCCPIIYKKSCPKIDSAVFTGKTTHFDPFTKFAQKCGQFGL